MMTNIWKEYFKRLQVEPEIHEMEKDVNEETEE